MNALEGVTLVDFGQYLAGPFGPMVIGDLGADVIKVEPITGDGMRNVNKPFFGCSRGKRDIALDLKTERGHEIALRLIERADIVHHNMTAGIAKKLRIAYDDCVAVNPDVVYCNTWAYGLNGPLARFGGLDPLFQAAAGIEYDAGPVQEGNPPLYLRFGMTDTANAMLSVVGCLAALYHQRRTGEGQELWTSLLDGAAVLEADAMLVDGVPVERPHLDKGQHGIDACYRLYRTSDGGYIQIAAVKPEHWVALCATLGLPELADDARFVTAAARRTNRVALEALLEPVFAVRTGVTWSRRFDDVGVPSQVPTDTHDGELALFDADNERLGLVTDYEHPLMGHMRQFGNLVDFSDTPGRIAGPPPMVGQHTREILGWLDYSDGEIDDLRGERVVYWPDESYAWNV
jgi:crotonobetainyl-CoA:carnitine CoA-transferase CaiB-like acyl-CoA transferase